MDVFRSMDEFRSMEPRLPHYVKQIKVIVTETVIGRGNNDDDPCRRVKQYWSLGGELLATHDEWAESRLPDQSEGPS